METYESVKSNPVQPEQKEKKKGGAWKGIVAVILAAGVVGSTTISAFNLVTLKSYIAEQKKEENPETTEDYVKIADNYEIKPTTNISDAYKSGDTSKLTDKEKETLDMAKKAIKDMKITDSMSDFEKEKAVYDWMTKKLQQDSGALTVIPSTQEDCDNPYGVLKYHNAVCVGYATTFRMFMQMMGIECKVEHNTEKFHSWDVVKIDGDWYITDIYSDAGNGNYANFNVTDAMYGQSQSWDRDYFPAANSLKYNMAYQNKKTVDSIYDLPKALRAAMDKKLGGVMVAFKEDITEEKAQVANAVVIAGQAKVQANAFGVAHVQVAVGLGREAGADLGGVGLALGVVGGVAGAACPAAGGVGAFFQIRFDDLAQKVAGLDGFGGCSGGCRLCVGGGGGTHSPILGGAYVANGTGAAGACTSRNNIAAVLCHPFGHLVRYARQRPTPPVGRLPSKRRFP